MDNTRFDFSDKTILIVEDCESSYLLLKEILEETGIKILHSNNGRDALNLCIDNKDINIVLMDIRIPEMDGLETTKRIKAIRNDLPILAQTASVFSEDKLRCKKAGCNGFIAKPIHSDKLIEILVKWL